MHGGHYTAYVRVRHHQASTAVESFTKVNEGNPRETSAENDTQLQAQGDGSPQNQDVPCDPTAPLCALASNSPTDAAMKRMGLELSDRTGLEFDTTSTHGQWYYISDTHVRTALESEVMKSQAYLLFYERLPFQ